MQSVAPAPQISALPEACAKRAFYPELEALRGIAAMAVACGHCLLVPRIAKTFSFKLALCVFNGRAAVSVFFVLSGFVLTLAFKRTTGSKARDYLAFETRRALRILPCFLVVAVIISCAAWMTFPLHYADWASKWFRENYNFPVRWPEVLKHLVLNDARMNVVCWTLQVELVGSALLPFIIWTNRRLPIWGKLAANIALVILANALRFHPPYVYVFGFIWPFYLGVLVADFGQLFWTWLPKAAARIITLCAWGALLGGLFVVRQMNGVLLEQFAAAFVVSGLAFGPHGALRSALNHSFSSRLGKISYCLYLVHFPLLYVAVFLLAPLLPAWVLEGHPYLAATIFAGASLFLAILTAEALHISVEKPFMEYSKTLCRRWFPEK